MKGSLIALFLVGLAGFLVYTLLRDDFADLVRLESQTRSELARANDELDAATRSLNVLRAARPNLAEIDAERAALQRQYEEQKKNLEKLTRERPGPKDARLQFIESRQAAQSAANSLATSAHSLAQRSVLMEDFTKNGQPIIKALNEATERTFALKNKQVAAGKTIDPVLLNRLEQIQRKRGGLQDMAKGFYAAACGVKRSERDPDVSVDTLATESRTIENESKALIADLDAAYKELEALSNK